MRKGGGKRKGSGFERYVCKALSRWVSNNSQIEDLFWRSAMSGGRATVARKQGKDVRQAGDITAVSPTGHSLTEAWYIECKFYRRVNLEGWAVNNTGKLKKWWRTCLNNAKHHERKPMLIVKQNGWPIFIVTRPGRLKQFATPQFCLTNRNVDVYLFEDVVKSYYGNAP